MTRWMVGAALIAVVLPNTALAQAPDTISLGEAVRTALANSRELAQAEAAVQAANARVTEAFAAALPDIGANASYQRNFRLPGQAVNLRDFNPSAPDSVILITFGSDNNWSAGLTLSQRLFEYGVFVGIGAAGRFKRLEAERARGVAQNVVTSTRGAYFDVLLAHEQFRLTEQSVDRVRQTVVETRAMNERGLASDYDVLRLEVQLANLEPNLRRARDLVRAARRQLAITMGLDADADFAVSGSLRDMNVAEPGANEAVNAQLLLAAGGADLDSLSFEDARSRAAEDRTDLRQTRLAVSLEEARVGVQVGEFFPRISLFSNYNVQAQENGSLDFFGDNLTRTTSFSGGIRVEVPLFQGFARTARVSQARAGLRQAEVQADLVEEQATSQLRTLIDGLAETRARVASQQRAVEQARRGYEIASAEYRAGTGSQLQITDAEVALRQSEFNYAQAVYDYLTTRSALEAAIGAVPQE